MKQAMLPGAFVSYKNAKTVQPVSFREEMRSQAVIPASTVFLEDMHRQPSECSPVSREA